VKKEPPNEPTQEEILQALQARAEEEKAKAFARLKADIDAGPQELTVQPGIPHPVRLQFAPIRCWKCHQPMKAARGYIFGHPDDDRQQAFIALRLVSDTRQLAALVADLRKADLSIAPVGHNYSKAMKGQYFSASCPRCSAICGGFHMSGMHFWESVLAPCRYPDCECRYTADTECQACDYHEIRIRLSEQELDEIAEQTGTFRTGWPDSE